MHRSRIARDVKVFALQLLRDQIGAMVFPAHRLDRKTSGVLLFAKSRLLNNELQALFREQKFHKYYVAIVRGFIPEKGIIDYPLRVDDKVQEAQTAYQLLKQYEIDLPFGKFNSSRYSLVGLRPQTGRFHQLRKHMAHLRHPIIGDRPHGCNKQNRLWKDQFEMTTMMLHAKRLEFDWIDGTKVRIEADYSSEFKRSLKILENQQV